MGLGDGNIYNYEGIRDLYEKTRGLAKASEGKSKEELNKLYIHIANLAFPIDEKTVVMKDCNDSPVDIPSHNHLFYEILFVESGNIKYQVDSKIYSVQKGDIIIIPPQVMHRPIFPKDLFEPYKRIVFWIDDEYLRDEIYKNNELGYIFKICQMKNEYIWHTWSTTFNAIYAVAGNLYNISISRPYGWQTIQDYGCLSLIAMLSSYCFKENNLEKNEKHSLLDGILSYIGMNYAQKITLESTSKQFLISKQTLSREFSKNMGMPFYKYITQIRLMEIQKKLLAGVPSTKAWVGCGFKEYSTFFKAFKNEYGTSPNEFVTMINSIK